MKYQRVRDELLEQLDGSPRGEPLPPERQLCTAFGVSRMTLRKALDELVADGHLLRRPGVGLFSAGTTATKVQQQLTATSFTEDMRRRGLRPGSRTLSASVSPAGARIGRRLQVSPAADVLQVTRLRLADGSPMAIETLAVPTALVPGLTGDDLRDTSFYALLAQRYGVVLAGGVQTIEPTVTDEEESAVLEVPVHTPAFLFERTSRDRDGRVVEFVRSVYRGDRYQIVTELAPPRDLARVDPTPA